MKPSKDGWTAQDIEKTCLNPAHTVMNVGIAHDRYNRADGATFLVRLRELTKSEPYIDSSRRPSP